MGSIFFFFELKKLKNQISICIPVDNLKFGLCSEKKREKNSDSMFHIMVDIASEYTLLKIFN